MLEATMTFRTNRLLLIAAALILATSSIGQARWLEQDQQSNQVQPVDAPDPIEQLRLTPDQRQRIRMILEQNKEDRQVTNRRVREANVALDQALDAEQIDETLIDQRINDLSAAQGAQLRMRIRTELQIRRELRPEQLAILKRLRLQVRDVMGGQRQLNRRAIRQGLRQNQPNRRNTP
jgi:Spy/CpxP family protein refolding chaperone